MEHSATPSQLVRKAAYGRTQLFLPNRNVLFREVKCMGGVVKRTNASVFHVLPDAYKDCNAACWHCCEFIEPPNTAMPLPRIYDAVEQVYHVYGRFCSPGCAKAYVLEHTTFDRGQHLNALVRMLRDVYGITDAIEEAPPRAALRRFGGVFDPRAQRKGECRLVEPPFVSYCMIAEERAVNEELIAQPAVSSSPMEDVTVLDEPDPDGLFLGFSEARKGAAAPPPAPHPPPPKSNAKRSSAPTAGPLSKYVRVEP